MAQSVLSVRMDSETKAAFAAFCEEAGMSVSTAINLFARQTVRDGRMPFVISLRQDKGRANADQRNLVLTREHITQAVSEAAAKKPGISRVILFGSYARTEARPDSDIDLRVEYDEGKLSLLELTDFVHDVQDATEKQVDVVSRRDLGNDAFAQAIACEGVTVYER